LNVKIPSIDYSKCNFNYKVKDFKPRKEKRW
jgi:hypothetical protein